MMTKINKKSLFFSVFLICIILFSSCFYIVNAETNIEVYSQKLQNQANALQAVYPNDPTKSSASGQQIILMSKTVIESVSFHLGKQGIVSANLSARIEYLTGLPTIPLYSALPNGTVIATSNFVNTSSFSDGWVNFTFTPPVTLEVGYYNFYCFVYNASVLSDINYVYQAYQTTNVENYGCRIIHFSSAWTNYATTDGTIIIYGHYYVVLPSPTPTPTPIPTGYGWYDSNGTWVPARNDYITPILDTGITTNNILLGIAVGLILLCCVLGAKFAGGWGFMAGLTLGIGLTYIFGLVPLWFVVLIGIVDAVALINGMTGSGKEKESKSVEG